MLRIFKVRRVKYGLQWNEKKFTIKNIRIIGNSYAEKRTLNRHSHVTERNRCAIAFSERFNVLRQELLL